MRPGGAAGAGDDGAIVLHEVEAGKEILERVLGVGAAVLVGVPQAERALDVGNDLAFSAAGRVVVGGGDLVAACEAFVKAKTDELENGQSRTAVAGLEDIGDDPAGEVRLLLYAEAVDIVGHAPRRDLLAVGSGEVRLHGARRASSLRRK